MSDHSGDPADQAGTGTGGEDHEADLGAPPDPALAARLDTMHRTLSTLGMRIDALVTSTTTYRAALTDRLSEYTELVSKLTRAQAADLEEYRRGSERAAAELRRGLSGSEEALQRVTERIEAMAAAGESGEAHEELLSELRTVQEAQDRLGRFVTESLDRFGDRVVERIADAQQATAGQLDSLRAAVADTGVVEEIREALLDVASGEVVGALWDEFRGARTSIDEVRLAVDRAEEAARTAADASARQPEDPAAALEPLRADVTSLTDAVRDLLAQAEVVDEPADGPDIGMLTAVASDVAALRTELARGLVVEPSDVLSGAVDQLRDDVAALDSRLDAMAELQQAVSELRTATEAAAGASADADGEAALARIESVLDRVSAGMGQLDERLAGVTGLDGRVAGLDERIGNLGDRLDGLDDVRGGVTQLQGSLRELRAAVDGVADAAAAAREAGDPDEALTELASVRDSVIALGERLDSIAVLQEAVTALRDEVRAAVAEHPAPAVVSEDLEGELANLRSGVDGVDGELRAVRGGVEDIIARLDEGLVLADEVAAPATTVPAELADHLAVLRDELAAGFDSLRALADEEPPPVEPAPAPTVDLRPVTELLEHLRDDLAELPGRIEIPPPPPAPEPATEPAEEADRYATLDPDVVDLLREEIRAAGAVPEDLLDQLRQELVALRRRIKLRAEGEIFTDEQLELIADAVARRLAE